MRFLIYFVCVVLTLKVDANSELIISKNCSAIFSRTKLNINNKGASQQFVESLRKALLEVNNNLDPLKQPVGYRIDLYKAIKHTSNYNGPLNQFGVIRSSEYYSVITKSGKMHSVHPEYSKAIAVHEYGHEVFAQNIGQYITNTRVQEFFKGRELIFKNQQQTSVLRQKIEKLKRAGLNNEEIIEHPYFVEFVKRRDLIDKGLNAYSINEKQKNIIISYDELFADVIAVIGTNRPRAVYRANNAGGRGHTGRDFTAHTPLRSWKGASLHEMFSPTRSHLWKQYLSHPKFQYEKPKILEALLRAIGKEIDFYTSIKFVDLPHEKNARLIDAFGREFEH